MGGALTYTTLSSAYPPFDTLFYAQAKFTTALRSASVRMRRIDPFSRPSANVRYLRQAALRGRPAEGIAEIIISVCESRWPYLGMDWSRSTVSGAPSCNNRVTSVGMRRHASNWESVFPHEADVDHRGAHRRLACARRAVSPGPILSRSPR